MGRPETDATRGFAINQLGNGLDEANHHEEALSVREAELATDRRLGYSESNILVTQGNLASTYRQLERFEEALRLRRDVYRGRLKLNGEEHQETLRAASNYADSLTSLKRFEEAKSLMRKVMPVARRVLGDDHNLTLKLRWAYAEVLYKDDGATLADLREAVTTLEDTERIARRVLGGANPVTEGIEDDLRDARAALGARGLP